MARRVDVATLVANVRSRSDQVTRNGATSFITDAEIATWLDLAGAELHDELCNSESDYLLKSYVFQTQNNQADYPLPDNFYRERGLETLIGSYKINARRLPFERRNDFQAVAGGWTWASFPLLSNAGPMVGLWDDSMHFVPIPDGGYQVTLWYYPVAALLTTSDGNGGANTYLDAINGWEEFVVDRAAQKCAERDENWDFSQTLAASVAKAKERIRSNASRRVEGEAPRATVVRGRNSGQQMWRRWWSWG